MSYFDILYILLLIVCVVIVIFLFIMAIKDYKLSIKLYDAIKNNINTNMDDVEED